MKQLVTNVCKFTSTFANPLPTFTKNFRVKRHSISILSIFSENFCFFNRNKDVYFSFFSCFDDREFYPWGHKLHIVSLDDEEIDTTLKIYIVNSRKATAKKMRSNSRKKNSHFQNKACPFLVFRFVCLFVFHFRLFLLPPPPVALLTKHFIWQCWHTFWFGAGAISTRIIYWWRWATRTKVSCLLASHFYHHRNHWAKKKTFGKHETEKLPDKFS